MNKNKYSRKRNKVKSSNLRKRNKVGKRKHSKLKLNRKKRLINSRKKQKRKNKHGGTRAVKQKYKNSDFEKISYDDFIKNPIYKNCASKELDNGLLAIYCHWFKKKEETQEAKNKFKDIARADLNKLQSELNKKDSK